MADDAIPVRILRHPDGLDLPLPAKATSHAAGYDLRARVEAPVMVPPGGRATVPTGVFLDLPEGFEGQVRPRSGLAHRDGVTLLNAPGTIDADYRGEIAVILVNHGDAPFVVRRGDRIAQLVVQKLPRVVLEETGDLSPSRRGAGGFGHTGER